MPEIDVVEERGAVVDVGVSIAPRDLSLRDRLKWRQQEESSANANKVTFFKCLTIFASLQVAFGHLVISKIQTDEKLA